MNERPKFLPAKDDPGPVQTFASGWRFPGPQDRLTINGKTGTGKTTFAMWLFAECADFDKKPWVFVDYKGEIILKQAEAEGMVEELPLDRMPKNAGVYVVRPDIIKHGVEPVVNFLKLVYQRENCGLFLDEATMIPELRGDGNSGGPYQALLSQGRSKNIPVWTLAQRPAFVNKMVYSESEFTCAFRLKSQEDFKKLVTEAVADDTDNFEAVWTVNGKIKQARLPDHYSRWFDDKQGRSWILKPSPGPTEILNILFDRVDRMKKSRNI
jgi:hypothetical protein